MISLRLLERLRGQVPGSLSPSLLDSFSQAKGEEPPLFPVLRLAAGPEGPSLGFFEGVKRKVLHATLMKVNNSIERDQGASVAALP